MRWYTKILLVGNIVMWSLVVGLYASATTVFSDDFDDATTTVLGSYNSWTKYNSSNYTGARITEGTNKYVIATTTADGGADVNWYREFAATAEGTICFDIEFLTDDVYFEFVYGNNSAWLSFYDTYGQIILPAGEVEKVFETLTWYEVCIQFNTDYDTYDLYVDGDLVNYNVPFNNSTTATTRVQISPVAQRIQTVAIDNIFVYDTLMTDPQSDYNILAATQADFTVPFDNICFYDHTDIWPCYLPASYNALAVGDVLTLIDEGQWPEDGIASTTLTITAGMTYNFSLSDPGEATTSDYCLFLEDDYTGDVRKCGVRVTWVATSTYLPDLSVIDDPCAAVTPSTGDFWDDFRFGIECGIQKVIAWVIVPSPNTYAHFDQTIQAAQANFPISSVYLLKETFAAMASSTDNGLTLPIGIWQDRNMETPEIIASVPLSSSTITAYVDEDFYENYYFYVQLFIYLFGVIYIIWRAFSLNRVDI